MLSEKSLKKEFCFSVIMQLHLSFILCMTNTKTVRLKDSLLQFFH